MEVDFMSLAVALSDRMGFGEICTVVPVSMDPDERGYSGARLLRIKCMYEDGRSSSFVCKYTGEAERAVMQRLTEQGRNHTPFSHTVPGQAGEAWMIMQDVGVCAPIPRSREWKAQVASALADLHVDNLSCGGEIPGLPCADEDYWERVVTRLSVDHFEQLCMEDNGFAAAYGFMLPELRRYGEQFAREMTALCRDGESLTVTHGDLQTVDGDHVRCFAGKPMIIDWGFCRLAPFYIDLVDYFTFEESGLYFDALHRRGISIRRNDFDACFHIASKYPAFIYMYPALMQYRHGSNERLQKLLTLLRGV